MLIRFIDDDFGYLQWLRDRPGTFVLEAERAPRRSFVVVHRSACPAISGPTHAGGWTTRMLKVCASTLEEIDSWSQDSVGGHPTRCQRCKPASTAPRERASRAETTSAPAEDDDPPEGKAAPAKRAPRAAAPRASRGRKASGAAATPPAAAPARGKTPRQRSR